MSNIDELRRYKELLDEGAITQEEFEQKKIELMSLENDDQEMQFEKQEGVTSESNDIMAKLNIEGDKKKKLTLAAGVAAILIILIIILTQCGGSISEEDVIGTWQGTWTNETGGSVSGGIGVESDGTYAVIYYVDGSVEQMEAGTWEISGKKLVTTCTNGYGSAIEGGKTTYKVDADAGSMENGGHYFYR